MTKRKIFVGTFLFAVATKFFFGTLGALAAHELLSNEEVEGVSTEKSLLNFRIEEVVERISPAGCVADTGVMSDETQLDPLLPARGSNLAPLSQDESMAVGDIRPTNCC